MCECECVCVCVWIYVYVCVCPAPYTLHPTPYTLHPTFCTLHPATYTNTLHPTPYTYRTREDTVEANERQTIEQGSIKSGDSRSVGWQVYHPKPTPYNLNPNP